MLWFDRHARSRKRLSPHIDGQLSPSKRATLEAHLAGCEACRRELDELRATISAVGGLVDVEPPRSFALTPRLLEQRATAPPAPAPALVTGMRLGSAAVALVLAVVLVGDLGVVGDGNNTRDESGASRQTGEFGLTESDATAGSAPAPAATGAAEEYAADAAGRASPEDLAASADKIEECPAGGAGSTDAAGGVGAITAGTPAPTPAPEPSPSSEAAPGAAGAGGPAACAPAVADVAPEASTPANVEPLLDSDEGESAAAAPSTQGDGLSALTVLEIVLAGALVALLGGVGIEYVLRRRAS